MIYLAPIQGFTDLIYRKAFSETFPGIDAFFIPYISSKNENVEKRHIIEILPENNLQKRVVPQVLAANEKELIFLSKIITDYGYSEINLNMGCPYTMVTNRGKGAGLLAKPETVKSILTDFFEKINAKLSVKIRSGLYSSNEIERLMPVLNSFPLTEIIFHPRIAEQLYSGKTDDTIFSKIIATSNHPVVYNGDINTLLDFSMKKELFPQVKKWMLGRGVLMNPFLPLEISGIFLTEKEKWEKLQNFHRRMLELYLDKMDNEGNVLNKMKQFWIYFSFVFPNQHKVYKLVKKTANMNSYKATAESIFRNKDFC